MALPAPTNDQRIECEKIQLNNSEWMLDKDVPYSIVVENITAEETRNISFAMFFMCFYIFLYIQFVSEKA